MGIRFKVYQITDEKPGFRHEISFQKQSLILGRGDSCDFVLKEPLSSRQHVMIDQISPTEATLIDLGSTNGTYVRGEKVQRRTMKSGDRFRIGSHEFELFIDALPPAREERELDELDPLELTITGKTGPELTSDSKTQVTSDDRAAILAAEKEAERAAQAAKVKRERPEPLPPATPETEPTLATPTLFRKKSADRVLAQARDSLQVTLLWNRTIQAIKHYGPTSAVTVGDSLRNDFTLPVDGIPSRFTLITRVKGRTELHFKSSLDGVVDLRGKRMSFEELAKRSTLSRQGTYAYELDSNDRVMITFGKVQLFAQFVPTQSPIPWRWHDTRDPDFFKIATSTTVLYLGLLALINFIFLTVGALTPEEEMEKIPERFARLILEPPPRSQPLKEELTTPPSPNAKKGPVPQPRKAVGGDEGRGERAKGSEGNRGRESGRSESVARNVGTSRGPDTGFRVPKGGGGQSSTGRPGAPGGTAAKPDKGVKVDVGPGILKTRKTISDEEVVMGSGILGVLGGKGGGGSGSQALAGRGLGGDVEGALQGLERGAVVDSRGLGGRGVQGVGRGGGGKSESVGGLALRGGGEGGGVRGSGLGSFGSKGEAEVSVVQEEVVYEGNLTAEQIREVVMRNLSQIRACYERSMTLSPGLSGRVDMYWEIGPGGRVVAVRVRQSTLRNSQVERCISDRIRLWQFPSPRGGGTAIVTSWPFDFRSL